MGSFVCKKFYHAISFYFSTHAQAQLIFDLEKSMILYYAYFVLQSFTSFAVSAVQVLKDCTDNYYLVRQMFLEVFLKESISVFSQFCFTTLINICILTFMKALILTSKLIITHCCT